METKVCKACGRELPIEEFPMNGNGRIGYCKECQRKKQSEGHRKRLKAKSLEQEIQNAKKARLFEFTPRELMEELARRGYKGKLEYVRVEVIDIENF